MRRRCDYFSPDELRLIGDGLREERRRLLGMGLHVSDGRWFRVQMIDVLTDEIDAVLAEHDEDTRLETEELMLNERG